MNFRGNHFFQDTKHLNGEKDMYDTYVLLVLLKYFFFIQQHKDHTHETLTLTDRIGNSRRYLSRGDHHPVAITLTRKGKRLVERTVSTVVVHGSLGTIG